MHNKEEYKELVCEFYEMSVTKTNKNLGFNLTKLRESAIAQNIIKLPFKEQLLNTFKSKLYKILDFIVLHYLNKKGSLFTNEFVNALRTAKNDEEKDELYKEFSEKLYSEEKLNNQLISVIESFTKGDYKEKENVIKIKADWIDSVKITENVHDFSKLIYFLSRFLDGKEINILLSRLISKFQVIDAFNKTVSELVARGDIVASEYTDKYSLFADSGEVATELNFIKSITKMTTEYENLNLECMYKEALLTLGTPEINVDSVYTTYFNKGSETKLSAFFKNNILESGRFKYVVKYLNPTQVPKIANNNAIVKFVLGRMPDSQIERYYLSVVNPKGKNIAKNVKINEIADLITKTDFNSFTVKELSNINLKDKSRKSDIPLREQKKALLSLYYTIVYIFVKNLVQINSNYFIGYFYLERDKYFFSQRTYTPFTSNAITSKDNYDSLTRIFTGIVQSDVKKLKNKDSSKLKRYIYIDLTDNFSNEYNSMYRENRNVIEHINVLSQLEEYINKINVIDDYFDVYHFILQRVVYKKIVSASNKRLLSVRTPAVKSLNYINSLLGINDSSNNFEHGVNVTPYSKTLLRAINIPMGYTLTRYKNLSYKKLFLRGREES